MALSDGDKSELLTNFVAITDTDEVRALHYLEASAWNLEVALSTFYEYDSTETIETVAEDPEIVENTGLHSPVVQTQQAIQQQKMSRKIATLSSVAAKDKPAGGDAGHSSGSDSEGEQRQSFYVGGSEHSGQTVLGNPKNDPNLIRNVFTAARAHGAEPVIDESSSSAAPARGGGTFASRGYRLDAVNQDDEVQIVGEQTASAATEVPVTLKMWDKGFSLGDGPLRGYEDEGSREFMQSVMQGRIPPELLRAHPHRAIDLRMEDHRHEAYKAPPMKPFSGSGQRLGALLPGVVEQPPVIAAAAPVVPAASPSRPAGPQTVNVAHFDASAPLTHVQMRLADGQRLIITGNLTSTVGDLREAIVNAAISSPTREFTLATAYPHRVLDDNSQTLQEAGLANSVVVHKFIN